MLADVVHLAALVAAQEKPAGPAGGCAGGVQSFPLLIIMLMIMYFVWLRPVTKERRAHQQMIEALKRGDEVVTQAGIFGRVVDISENIITLEVAKNVKIRVLRNTVAKKAAERAPDRAEDKKKASTKDA